jgi:chromatin segregation and condensation protein Rec8/ScpA/Scc1 (kleisin family)
MAETFSTRLWPALSDEELAAASSASLVTTTSTVTTHQQRLLLPSTSSAQLSDLSAFLASSASTSAPSASQQTLLDDLLRDEEQPHLLQSHDNAAVSTAMTDVGVLSDAAFFSLGEESQRGEQTYSSSASGSPSTGTSNLRLLQLETNYERKKKRAKINRKDLNSRFQELMDILHLKEDRKLNRAKILEKTIEHIEKLTAELKALKAGHQPQHTSGRTSVALHRPPQLHAMTSAMAHSMGQHSIASSAHGAATGGAPLLPYNPAHTHPWGPAAVGTSLPLASMMWVPCPVVTSSGMVLKRAAPGRSADTASRKRGRVESVESVSTTISEPVSSASETDSAPEAAQVRAASSAANESSLLEWSAQEIPTLLAYCDAWTLVAVMKTSRELRRASQRRTLWEDLCRVRWRLPPTVSVAEPFEQWQEWHRRNRIPDYTTFTVRWSCAGIA